MTVIEIEEDGEETPCCYGNGVEGEAEEDRVEGGAPGAQGQSQQIAQQQAVDPPVPGEQTDILTAAVEWVGPTCLDERGPTERLVALGRQKNCRQPGRLGVSGGY